MLARTQCPTNFDPAHIPFAVSVRTSQLQGYLVILERREMLERLGSLGHLASKGALVSVVPGGDKEIWGMKVCVSDW